MPRFLSAAVVVVLSAIFFVFELDQDGVVVQAFSCQSRITHPRSCALSNFEGHASGRQQSAKKARKRSSTASALSVSFFSSQTADQAQEVPTQASTVTDAEAAPAFLIERISEIPTNERLFHRISNMCIDVFFKELLLEQQQGEDNDVGRTRKRDKLL